jgi:hypothetical protein
MVKHEFCEDKGTHAQVLDPETSGDRGFILLGITGSTQAVSVTCSVDTAQAERRHSCKLYHYLAFLVSFVCSRSQ